MLKTNNKYKPIYKKFLRLKENIQNKNLRKFLNFKRNKWQNFIKRLVKFNYRKKKYYNDFFFLPKFGVYRMYDTNKYLLQYSSGISKKKKYRFYLVQKQLFNYFYGGLPNSYIKNLVKTSFKSSVKNTFTNSLESRLDTILYRSNFAISIRNARQLVRHKHIQVNGTLITNYSYTMKKGDLLKVNLHSIPLIKHNIIYSNSWPIPLSYLTINYRTLEVCYNDNTENYHTSLYYPFCLNTNNLTNYYA